MGWIFDTPSAINEWTSRAKLRLAVMVEKVAAYKADANKQARLDYRECKTCYYLLGDRISGQAFTTFDCGVCKERYSWPNTGAPRLCATCADRLRVCQRCGADINHRQRKEPHHV